MPFLLKTNQEEDDLKYEGENFSYYLNNLIVENKDKSIKVISAKILKLFSENEKGFSKYVINYCIELLDICFKFQNGFSLESFNGYSFIEQNDYIFTKLIPCNETVDMALLALCILNEKAKKSKSTMYDQIYFKKIFF